MKYYSFDEQYIWTVCKIFTNGVSVKGRDNLSYRQLFGVDFFIDLREEFPACTLRKLPIENILREFVWDISGSSKVSELGKAKHFWDFLAIGDFLPGSYGSSWRHWPVVKKETEGLNEFRTSEFDQLRFVHNELENNCTNRQLVMQTYNPSVDTKYMKCPPCHPCLVFSSDETYLDLLVMARSWDMALGVPLDTFRYALLLQKMAEDALLTPRFLKITSANTHIYDANLKQIQEMINRRPMDHKKIHVEINKAKSIFELDAEEDFKIFNYNPHAAIKMEIAK